MTKREKRTLKTVNDLLSWNHFSLGSAHELPFIFLVSQLREKVTTIMKRIDGETQDLALKTKKASGVWPPKDSELEMVLP